MKLEIIKENIEKIGYNRGDFMSLVLYKDIIKKYKKDVEKEGVNVKGEEIIYLNSLESLIYGKIANLVERAHLKIKEDKEKSKLYRYMVSVKGVLSKEYSIIDPETYRKDVLILTSIYNRLDDSKYDSLLKNIIEKSLVTEMANLKSLEGKIDEETIDICKGILYNALNETKIHV